MRIGINGFGRMGRLVLRARWDEAGTELDPLGTGLDPLGTGLDPLGTGLDRPGTEIVAVNEPHASAETMALLLAFDSIHGRWDRECSGATDTLTVDGRTLAFSQHESPADIPWHTHDVDLVLECSGRFTRRKALAPHFANGA